MKYYGTDNLEAVANAVNYNNYLIQEIRRWCKITDKIVDFGAGIGTYSSALKEAGYNVLCVEPDADHQQRLHDKGFQCCSQLNELSERSVDFIYSLNVLEHIDDDQTYIQKIWRLWHTSLTRIRCVMYYTLFIPAVPACCSPYQEVLMDA
jgi:2-polyprenyl-3-methyl-5-hydroxy-6-metoxy-1,4-benzoquinol methylase